MDRGQLVNSGVDVVVGALIAILKAWVIRNAWNLVDKKDEGLG